MGGLIHPIGPEAEQTYWLRRGAVLVVLVAVLVGAGFMISSISQAVTGSSEPAAGPPPEAPAPAPVETPAATAPPATTPAAAPSAPATTEQPKPSQAAKPSEAPKPAPSQPAPAQSTATFAGGQPATTAPANPAPAPTASASFTLGAQQPGGQPAGQPVCDPAKVRVGLDGPRQVSAGVPVTFRVKVANDSGQPCVLPIDAKTFELKIYSGTDRIWSTLDCLSGMPAKNPTLNPGQEFGWDQEWRANRSVGDCKAGAESLKSGTYVATAQLKDARPVQVVMQLQG